MMPSQMVFRSTQGHKGQGFAWYYQALIDQRERHIAEVKKAEAEAKAKAEAEAKAKAKADAKVG